MDKIHISIVTPVYGCGASLCQLYERLEKTLSSITNDFEIIMVNDASPDSAWETIKLLSKKDKRVKGMNLSRNFGQHKAITAGLDYAQGKWIVVMDCDLQDQPEEIVKLYNKVQEGYDLVVGRRAERKDRFLKKLSSKIFFTVYNYFTGTRVDNRIGNFGIYSKKVIENTKKLREQTRSFGLFVLWVGFSRIEIDVDHAKRVEGKSAYTFGKLLDLAMDSIITHSNRLLKLFLKLGFMIALSSILYSIWLIIDYFFFSRPIAGWTSVMVSVFFLAGLIIGSIGVIGLYIDKIFEEVKGRPLYIIESTTFEEELK